MTDVPKDEDQLPTADLVPAERAESDITKLHADYRSRLVAANLRTEAVKAGMIDLDGLKLIDLSSVGLDEQDAVVGGSKLMDDLRRNKPWLFGSSQSSSSAVAPASRPVRQKNAMDMSDDEYSAARAALTRHRS